MHSRCARAASMRRRCFPTNCTRYATIRSQLRWRSFVSCLHCGLPTRTGSASCAHRSTRSIRRRVATVRRRCKKRCAGYGHIAGAPSTNSEIFHVLRLASRHEISFSHGDACRVRCNSSVRRRHRRQYDRNDVYAGDSGSVGAEPGAFVFRNARRRAAYRVTVTVTHADAVTPVRGFVLP